MGALKSQCQFIVDFSSLWKFINRVSPHRQRSAVGHSTAAFLFGGSRVKAPWSPTYGRSFFGRGRRSPLVCDGSLNNEQYAYREYVVPLPMNGQTTDKNGQSMSSFIGSMIKDGIIAPLDMSWHKVPNDVKEKLWSLDQKESLYESQGGPIILSQIENGYGPLSLKLGNPGYQYMTWAANMAVGMNTGVPWAMCKEDDAPDPVINTCNGFYCDNFAPNRNYKPIMWTEAWTGWFTEFGVPTTQRPVQDLAFAVANFIQKYHGGTNFGRSAGGPFIITSYDYDAPLDEYGLIRQPKYGHLKGLHKLVKKCEKALVSPDPIVTSLRPLQQAHVYDAGSTLCSLSFKYYDTQYAAKVLTDYFS
ncbi:Beta-galactosidase 3 [Orobanche hederae]